MDFLSSLDTGVSLMLFEGERPLFSDRGHWLHPLFELRKYLENNPADPSKLSLHDRAAGLAAAALISHTGIRKVNIDLISEPAVEYFKAHDVEFHYTRLVPLLECATERVLSSDMPFSVIEKILTSCMGRGCSLSVENLVLGYGSHRVIENLSFSLKNGENLLVLGDNGAGKSTLLKGLCGVLPPLSGRILIDGSPRILPGSVAYVKQSGTAKQFPVSVDEVVAMGLGGEKISKRERSARVDLACRRVKAHPLRGRDFFSLSGGERQRVQLARALCQGASLILLDEPTTFLDRSAKPSLIALLKSFSSPLMPTVIVVSHDNALIDGLGWRTMEISR